MSTEDALDGIGQVSEFVARTQRGWVAAVATIFAGAAHVAKTLLSQGKDPEEIRTLIEDLVQNPPSRVDFKRTVDKLDKIKEEREKAAPKPPSP